MVDKIIVGIVSNIDSLFGDYSIYSEAIPQKLQPPAFFIQLLQSGLKQVVGNRYWMVNSFDIVFFPEENGAELQECYAVAGQLLDGLEYIATDDRALRGTDLHSEVIDGVLHVFVQYNLHVLKETIPEELMDELTQEGRIKG